MTSKSKSFKDLIVWQKAHDLVMEIYGLTKKFPNDEIYSLTPQLRRASISVPANIAEGFARKGKADKLRFYNIALASLSEVNYFLFLSKELQYGDTDSMIKLAEEVGKLLNSYSKSIKESSNKF